MEATKSSSNAERSKQTVSFKDDKKHLSFEMTQRLQSSGSEDKVRVADQPQTAAESPSAGMESQALASGSTLTSKSGEQCHVRLRRKTISLPNKQYLQSEYDLQLSEGPHRKEQKSGKTGKYVCQYCGRACAKPSVLKKHIRSHTGERPYPCIPCGFSFKTKSNLYKHRKSHAHAVKAGSVPYSEQDSKHADEESTVGEGEMQSDAEQSTDTDEEVTEDLSLDTTIHNKDTDIFITEKSKKAAKKDDVMLSTPSLLKKETASSGKVSLWQFREMKAPPAIAQVDQMVEFSTIKQRLALRLSEKKSQDSDQSLSLPSSYSKGSTDSGYFSRSESAEQQFNPASASAKSYQEIMFGKCYKPTARPKQSITVQTCMTDINEATSSFMIKLNKSTKPGDLESCVHRSKKDLVRSLKIDSLQEEDYQDPDMYQGSTDLLELESGMFLRSNSLPTSSNSNLNAPQGLRSSNSFDERMTGADVTYRGAVGIRRLMRQTAFEHSANEGHGESDCYTHLACSLKSELKIGTESYQETESWPISQSQMSETSTRKRRKDKSVMEEEDSQSQGSSNISKIKESALDTGFSDTERRAGSNVISVIQHTNKLNWSNASETSSDIKSHSADKAAKFNEKEHRIEGHGNDTNRSSERIDWQWGSSVNLKPHMMKQQLASQSSIQVPEIRVTVEPDRPDKNPDAGVKQREKHTEEFQWPQRSETLSQFPVEKLPPKKKRLRLAEMECSSGESSFESACTSLSRSPSQDSNLSHSSSFSQSLDREEILNIASQTNSDEFNKPLEFLSVPPISQSNHKEMRRSASEQAPYNFPIEVSEFRSKSFDYGSLSPSSSFRQEDVKERRRGFLVRQTSLSGEPDACSTSKQFSVEGSIEEIRCSLTSGPPFQQHKQISSNKHYTHSNVCLDIESITRLIKKEPEDFQAADTYISLRNTQEDCSQSLGNVLTTIAVLSQAQQALASQRMSSLLVPVRIQMQVPSYGSVTYTSISHILDSQTQNPILCVEPKKSICESFTGINNTTSEPSQISRQARGQLRNPQASPAKLNTGIPLSLTSKTISTTEAPSGSANKRMLSPASSIELFIEAKQQKRVKDENIYGQIVKELGAVELGNLKSEKECPKNIFESANIQELTEEVDMDEVNLDSYPNAKLQSPASIPQDAAIMECKPTADRTMATRYTALGAMPTEITGALLFSKFPGLHTTTCVSWCYLNSTKPNSTQTATQFSEYASWFMRCHNPNPPSLNTGMVLALLRSKQRRQDVVYTIATMYQPGLLVTSTPWRQKQEQLTLECNEEEKKHDVRLKDIGQRCKSLREDVALSVRQPEPTRVRIFEGGYKSNEDYVYVRGRGRGKYICEECGIRCKKPSMLKKHIRTHTDVRPYACKCCNFAFKTKGNLTKHMKSKSHMKKCLELGVSPTAIDSTEDADDPQKSPDIRPAETPNKHQFSDVEDSDGVDEDGDEPEDEEDDECDGDSTPKTLSRSTSPQPYAVNKPFFSSRVTKPYHDTSLNPSKEQLEISFPGTEDDFTYSELCPPQLLSPCWDSPRPRYTCPRGDLSPQGHLLSSRDSSPLRAVSPRRDLSIRGDFSPIQQLSLVRPASSDSIGRAQSPMGRQKGVLRAASPRRGSYQHRAHVDQGRSVRFQTSPHRPVFGVLSDMGMDQVDAPLYVPVGLCSTKDPSTSLHTDILSHLPLHSQGQVPTPVPMIPIGGLRMPSTSSPGAAGERNFLPSIPKGNISESACNTSAPIPDPGLAHGGEMPHTSLPHKDDRKEESVQICAKAIASLRITSDDATDKTPKS
nr:human immunodeficiency virus type I enhancer-binding protein 2 homolog [Misgurnus anguillicaudatus]XP_055027689.1 human immunodeficiency virus type I enhancer-binding protein 2 homolog [Misgurnus anguillicaudatus]XP_055027690.1 human immunodeficiency virus type I enhancer-binding protein 2 homolog [Misgurnus anguillicaudatus]XP_055027691.1 human immunodeficiency virus type I enhancer-binding protein 2 homolog [Misgurnus anguillicaudatus]XP_055027692.1 human immunodeficiency virus type I enha